MGTSSARPAALERYAKACGRVAMDLARTAARLDGAAGPVLSASDPLDRFMVARSADAALGSLRRLAAALTDLADFAAAVGRAFEQADGGAAGGLAVASDQAVDRRLARLDHTSALARLVRHASPGAVAALFATLDRDLLYQLLKAHPALVGDTDGVPPAWRYRANRRRIERRLRLAERRHDQGAITHLSRLLAHGQVLVFDPGHHKVAVVEGDLSRARHVAVVVPGVGTSPASLWDGKGTGTRARRLYRAAEPYAAGGVAIVAWQAYDAPADMTHGAFDKRARDGGRRLARLLRALVVGGDRHLTVVGHSYGSLVGALGVRDGGPADDLVVAGSPGLGVDRASSLGLEPRGHVYAERAPGDPIGGIESFGEDPASVAFGGTRLTTNAKGHPHVDGHSDYFDAGSVALDNTARVVAGRASSAQHQQVTVADVAGEGWERAHVVSNPDEWAVRALSDHYHGPGASVIDDLDRLYRTRDGLAQTGVHAVVDFLTP